MPISSQLLIPIIGKIERAEKQIADLRQSIENWLGTDPINIERRFVDDGRTVQYIVNQFDETSAEMNVWKYQIGECVHNLRSALDNLVFALACIKKDPPEREKSIAFPIYDNRKSYYKDGVRKIDQLPDAAVKLIEKFQPFQRDGSTDEIGTPERDPLILLQWLNNSDKHRTPMITALNMNQLTQHMNYDMTKMKNPFVMLSAKYSQITDIVKPGAVLFEIKSDEPQFDVNVQMEIKIYVGLDTLLGKQEVITTLQGLHYYTNLVTSHFGDFFKEK